MSAPVRDVVARWVARWGAFWRAVLFPRWVRDLEARDPRRVARETVPPPPPAEPGEPERLREARARLTRVEQEDRRIRAHLEGLARLYERRPERGEGKGNT